MNTIKFCHIAILCIALVIFSCTRRSNNYSSGIVAQRPTVEQNSISNPPIRHEVNSSQVLQGCKLSASEVFDKYNTAVFMVYTSNGWNEFQGSGFFINSSGLAISNYHVFKGTEVGLETIKLANGTKCKLKSVVAKSSEYDFILFYVDIPGICNYIPVSNRQSKVGEKVFTIGSPRGLENTFSSGEISQFRGDYVIQINAPIDHGSSGGALINEYGEVIGITSAGYDDSGANLNFALDIKAVKPYIK